MTPTAETYSELEQAFAHFNRCLFGSGLPEVIFTYQRNRRTYGYFVPERFGKKGGQRSHELAINPVYFVLRPPVVILGHLVHNMCHIWQFEHGTPGCPGYHNQEFASIMKEVGLLPSDTGAPGGKETGEKIGQSVIPGGKFEAGAKELLESSWSLSWFDRFPPAEERPGGDVAGSSGPSLNVPPIDDDGAAAAEGQDEFLDVVPQEAENRSNREKYCCEGCKTNLWGRPGLNVICGECGKPFSVVS